MTGWPTHVRGHRTLWSLLHDWEPNLLKYFKESNTLCFGMEKMIY